MRTVATITLSILATIATTSGFAQQQMPQGPPVATPVPADAPVKVKRSKAASVEPQSHEATPKRDKEVLVEQGDSVAIPRLIRRSEGSYEIVYSPRMAIPLWTQQRFQTTVTLPQGEEILRANAADDDVWEVIYVRGSNIFYVKPFYENSKTSVQVITKAKNRYVFKATSGVANKGQEPMLILDILPTAWQKAELERAAPIAKGRRGAGAGLIVAGEESGDNVIAIAEAQRRISEAEAKARREGWDLAMEKRDEELREYAVSIFRNANLDYKWSGDTSNFRLVRVFDDGRCTYLCFDSGLNTMPAFWEIHGGETKEVTLSRAVFDPNILIIGKLFKEGVITVDKKNEIKIKNKGYKLPAIKDQEKIQLQGENKVKKAA
jgi:type IV secretory pathway VirB9-like protein